MRAIMTPQFPIQATCSSLEGKLQINHFPYPFCELSIWFNLPTQNSYLRFCGKNSDFKVIITMVVLYLPLYFEYYLMYLIEIKGRWLASKKIDGGFVLYFGRLPYNIVQTFVVPRGLKTECSDPLTLSPWENMCKTKIF